MNTTTTSTDAPHSPIQLAGGSVARAAAMVSAIERLSLLLEDRCDPEGFDLGTAIQACAATAASALQQADGGLSAVVLN